MTAMLAMGFVGVAGTTLRIHMIMWVESGEFVVCVSTMGMASAGTVNRALHARHNDEHEEEGLQDRAYHLRPRRLSHVGHHVVNHAFHMIVERRIEHLFALSFGADEACTTK